MMQTFPQTLILRHRKENLKKCSLRGLESRDDMMFLTYPKDSIPELTGYILLTPNAEPLTENDYEYGLFLVDGTWRYAEKMVDWIESGANLIKRSLPKRIVTAYPRRQEVSDGLASIEALYSAYVITGRDPTHLLDNYYWREAFLAKNPVLR